MSGLKKTYANKIKFILNVYGDRHKAVRPSQSRKPFTAMNSSTCFQRKDKQTTRESISPNKSKKEKVLMKQKQKDIFKHTKKYRKDFFFLFGKG